jgi:GSH-dependent disulfide-bond oxidoreductase
MIELHSSPTPNGQKIMIMLEELGIEWKHVDVNLRLAEHLKPEFLKMNPNNKIPVIVDTDGPGGGRYSVMESGAILYYLAEKTGKFMSADPRKRYDTLQWLMFQMASVGPMFGQANYYTKHVKGAELQYARDRYVNEAIRLFRVMDNRLREKAWLAGDDYTIVDMAVYPWTKALKDLFADKAAYPNVTRWYATMEARPAVQRSNKLSEEIRARMTKAAEGKQAIDIHDNKNITARLSETK